MIRVSTKIEIKFKVLSRFVPILQGILIDILFSMPHKIDIFLKWGVKTIKYYKVTTEREKTKNYMEL